MIYLFLSHLVLIILALFASLACMIILYQDKTTSLSKRRVQVSILVLVTVLLAILELFIGYKLYQTI